MLESHTTLGNIFECAKESHNMDDRQRNLHQERKWIQKAQKDISEFRPLYDKYADAVFRFFVRRTDDVCLAEELTSNTFFKALDKLSAYRWQGRPFGAWLFKIAGNELRRQFRDQKPIYIIEEDKLDCLPIEAEELPDYLPELISALDELSEQDLRVLELKFFENQSFKEISQLLEIGESAAKMRVYRLLGKLKRRIETSYDKA